jgi:MoxR-like ATPase
MTTRTCPGYDRPAHEVEVGVANWRNDTIKYCRDCDRAYRSAHSKAPGARAPRKARAPQVVSLAEVVGEEFASDAEVASSHEYVPMPDLLELERVLAIGAQKRPAANVIFVGPSGSGKTDGARDFAARVGLPFVKVDAASMTDPEAWFGTREIIVSDGVAVTEYRPSTFVEWVQKPCVLLIDEVSRVRDEHRNVLLPLIDHTRAVMNPLTGGVVHRHPMCFIIMAGNIGINFTGTNAIDPAFWSRSRVVEFDYLDAVSETRVVVEASGCSDEDAQVFIRFANETRAKAKMDDQYSPISTRELIEMGRDVADGMTRDLAVKFNALNACSGEGGSSSVRADLEKIWNGVRVWKPTPVASAPRTEWTCPTHGTAKTVPAGVSSKTGRPYQSFKACTVAGCPNTEDRSQASAPTGPQIAVKTCGQCQTVQAVGRNTFCSACGATL